LTVLDIREHRQVRVMISGARAAQLNTNQGYCVVVA
jgi:hypothetical protein